MSTLNEILINATLTARPFVVGEYTVTVSEIPGGHRLAVTRGGQTQTADIMDGVPPELDDLIAEVARNTKMIGGVSQRLDWLYKLLNRQTFDILTDNDAAYEKAVPAGAQACAIEAVGGKTIVLNQLVNPQTSSVERTGITFTSDGDNGTITASGTATATATINVSRYGTTYSFKKGHRYMLVGCPAGGSSDTFYLHVTANTAFPAGYRLNDVGSGRIATAQGDEEAATSAIVAEIKSGTTVDGIVFEPRLYDLTLMFGKETADEITDDAAGIAAAYALGVPSSYVGYNEGELRSANVYRAVIIDANEHEVGEMTIPNTVRGSVTGWGWSAGKIYNSIEYNAGTGKWTYVQRVASVDLGTLTWYAFPASDNVTYPGFDAKITNKKKVSNSLACEKYFTGSSATDEMRTDMDNCEIRRYTPNPESTAANYIAIRDDAFAGKTPDEVKTALNGVTLYYGLETPIETDITDMMPPYDLLTCYAGLPAGTTGMKIVFDQVSSELKLPVFNSESYFINISEAIGNV